MEELHLLLLLLLLLLHLLVMVSPSNGDPIVPAFIIFGDSVVDVGNNNYLTTVIKSNFPPYGRDFPSHKPTGRFCNGKLAIDFSAEYLGFGSYPPAYLSDEAKGKNILSGVNFGSAASGLYDGTAALYGAVSLSQQLNHYKDYKKEVEKMVGKVRAKEIMSGAIHLLSAGSSDFVQNYYINPLLNSLFTAHKFSDILINAYSSFINSLYEMGARRIGVTSLPPTGCLPAAITLFGGGSGHCVERINNDAVYFNYKLNITSQNLAGELPELKLVVFNIYDPLLDIILNPADNGFFEARKACCGTGLLESSILCNSKSIGTCSNATQYIFWDGFHPSEAVNEVLALHLLSQGIQLIS